VVAIVAVVNVNVMHLYPYQTSSLSNINATLLIFTVDANLTPTSFLTSPIVEIAIGEDDNQTILTAHQTLLIESPLLSRFVDKFEASGPVRTYPLPSSSQAFPH
jgi:hypothetical protein